MKPFRTPVIPDKPEFSVSFKQDSMFIGSCFSEHIGSFLATNKFPVITNPFGVVYNPLSVARQLELLVHREAFTKDHLKYHNELWFSFMHYSLFSHPDPGKALELINNEFKRAKERIISAGVLFLTFGTAYVYRYRKTGDVVANCHKIPADEFDRELAGVDEIVHTVRHAIDTLMPINPGLKIVLTVSPVRHWKDGAVNNQRSKSTLILAIRELQEQIPGIYYFPAYEIFMDELRDYRFYASDMLHPSEEGLNYIRDLFVSTFLDDRSQVFLSRIRKIMSGIQHRPRHPNTKSHTVFLDDLRRQIKELQETYPSIDLSRELEQVSNNV